MILGNLVRARRESPTVDVTAFLSLMVILIPFLLISTVLSQLAVLELQTAQDGTTPTSTTDQLGLQVVVRQGRIEVRHQGQQQPVLLERSQGDEVWRALARRLSDLKARFPQSTEATILLEPQVPYDVLVRVMDVVRINPQRHGVAAAQQAFFPDLTLGEVPADGSSRRQAR